MKKLLLALAALALPMSSTLAQTPKTDPKLIEVAEFGRYQPIGLAVSQDPPANAQTGQSSGASTPTGGRPSASTPGASTPGASTPGRIFVTFPKRKEYQYGLAEIVDGKRQPYPNAEWNQWDSLQPKDRFMNVQALFVDQTNMLWVLDPANPDDGPPIIEGIKLLRINLKTNKVEQIYRFEDLPREQTGLNDVRIDTQRKLAYLSDPKRAGIVVLDLITGKSRTLLEKHKSTSAEPGFKLILEGKEVKDQTGKSFSSNVNGIALTHDFRYFYYRAINQTKLYRIPVDVLANPALTPQQVAAGVELVGETGISHGMIADAAGNVYLTDSPNKAIRRVTPAGKFETVVRDERLIWPDSFGIGPDGYLYVTAAQINRTPKNNDGQDKVSYPFRLYKVKI